MKNLFTFFESTGKHKRKLLLNESGLSPANIGYGYYLTCHTQCGRAFYSIIANSSEIAVVERIFIDYLSCKSISYIVSRLNEENIPTRQKRGWNYNAVSNILKNENYIGLFSFYEYEVTTVNEIGKFLPKRIESRHTENIPDLACISLNMWNKVQDSRIKRVERLKDQYKTAGAFSPKRKRRLRKKIKIIPAPVSQKPQWPFFATALKVIFPLNIFEFTGLRTAINQFIGNK